MERKPSREEKLEPTKIDMNGKTKVNIIIEKVDSSWGKLSRAVVRNKKEKNPLHFLGRVEKTEKGSETRKSCI